MRSLGDFSGRKRGCEGEDPKTETVFLRGLTRSQPSCRYVHLKMAVTILTGEDRYECRALIDTGAEVNLIKRGLCDPKYNRESQRKLRLMAANNQRLGGGETEVEMKLRFEGVDSESNESVVVVTKTVCYEADIMDDMILSFEWCRERHMDICASEHGLVHRVAGGEIWMAGMPSNMSTSSEMVRETRVLRGVSVAHEKI